MKKLLSIITLTCLMFGAEAKKLPIYKLRKHDGGFWGFERVNAELMSFDGNLGWDLGCFNPGRSSCSAPNALDDLIDEQAKNILLDQLNSTLNETGNSSGSLIYKVSVEGEAKERVYTFIYANATLNEHGVWDYELEIIRDEIELL